MRRSNIIVFVLLIAASAFLLFLWYYLGLYRVDEPLDLVLSIIWWVMVASAIVAITRVEKERKKRIRTVYVSADSLFNPEVGLCRFTGGAEAADTIYRLLDELKYGFAVQDMTSEGSFEAKCLVVTDTFSKENDTWKGQIVSMRTKKAVDFEDRRELTQLIARIVSG